ncbi:dipeptidyl aminopeptidase/acylaminoacyl peptidase [Sphingopyxis panaciterrae]|uniref:DPP IV N-terminal domain-containing protein n=1 Tax=Sphingopyxis panaciterrae TaxID=363841 RepID=UPI001420A1FA|nr:dipeptidyl aminopeptidase/acylaminoacyl peptidase [Sphingopyxis panaciterrae]
MHSEDEFASFEQVLGWSHAIQSRRVAANWMRDGRFWFSEGAGPDAVLKICDPKDGSVVDLIDIERARISLQRLTGHAPSGHGLPFEAMSLSGDCGVRFTYGGQNYELDLETYCIAPMQSLNRTDAWLAALSQSPTAPGTFTRPNCFGNRWSAPEAASPDGRWFLSLRDHNLCLRGADDGQIEFLTSDGEEFHEWDVETPSSLLGGVVRDTVSSWSPDSLRFFATKFDARATAPISRTHMLGYRDSVEWLRMARAGDALPTYEPFVVDVLSRRPVRINVEIADRFILFIGWHESGREVYFAQFSRDFRTGTLFGADPATGAVRAIFSETAETFVRIQHDVICGRSGCTILPNDLGFLWESERDGWKHLYHYALDGTLRNQVTCGDWPVCEVQGVDAEAGLVYFTAHHDQARPYDTHLCRAPLAGGRAERLTEGEGVHEIQLSPDSGCFVTTVSRPDSGPQSSVCNNDGRVLHRFPGTDLTKLRAAGWTAPEQFCVKAADGETDLWGLLFKPRDFDPAKRYPVVEYIYGGPQMACVPHYFETENRSMLTLKHALPQLGYVVVTLDARGTPERSKAFHDAVYQDWRRHVTADHAAALRNLAKDRPWMDMDRVGIWGHSWGGYYTIANLLDAPDLYKAGVASAPGLDCYSVFLSEPYLGGVPGEQTKSAYDDADVITEASRLKGELMLAAGTNDVAMWHDAVKMSDALIKSGKQHEFVILPEQYHAYGKISKQYLTEKIVRFFAANLQAATSAAPSS